MTYDDYFPYQPDLEPAPARAGVTRRKYLTEWSIGELGISHPYLLNESIYSIALSHPEGWLDTIVDAETGEEITEEVIRRPRRSPRRE
jgi:hypothetical protein